jgi:hypothetical protein
MWEAILKVSSGNVDPALELDGTLKTIHNILGSVSAHDAQWFASGE